MRYLPLLLVAFVAVNADHPVQKITFKDAKIDSLADILGIKERSGTVEFTAAERKGELQFAHLEVELYRDGRRLPENRTSGGIVAIRGERGNARLQFSFKAVDLDYLTLGGGKKGHCRLVLRISNGPGTTGSGPEDVAKDECDVCKMGGVSSFGPKAGNQDRIPLF